MLQKQRLEFAFYVIEQVRIFFRMVSIVELELFDMVGLKMFRVNLWFYILVKSHLGLSVLYMPHFVNPFIS